MLRVNRKQRRVARYSVAILNRPHTKATLKRLSGGRISTAEDDEREGLMCQDDSLENLTTSDWEKSMMLEAGQDCARNRGGRQLKKKIIWMNKIPTYTYIYVRLYCETYFQDQ